MVNKSKFIIESKAMLIEFCIFCQNEICEILPNFLRDIKQRGMCEKGIKMIRFVGLERKWLFFCSEKF